MGPDFTLQGLDPLMAREVWVRRRQFPPSLLATFPFDGVPTIVVGTAERTAKHSPAWVLTLLHEHFHQWQYSQPNYYPGVARLGLAHGDSTGMWMLNYPFPYGSAAVEQSTRELALAVLKALDADSAGRQRALSEVVRARNALQSRVSPEEYRYLEFQLWQEGVARFLEYASAIEAAKLPPPNPEFQRLPDYESYGTMAQRMRQDLAPRIAAARPRAARSCCTLPVGRRHSALARGDEAGLEDGVYPPPVCSRCSDSR
jgi:hypothetical protein